MLPVPRARQRLRSSHTPQRQASPASMAPWILAAQRMWRTSPRTAGWLPSRSSCRCAASAALPCRQARAPASTSWRALCRTRWDTLCGHPAAPDPTPSTPSSRCRTPSKQPDESMTQRCVRPRRRAWRCRTRLLHAASAAMWPSVRGDPDSSVGTVLWSWQHLNLDICLLRTASNPENPQDTV